MSDYMTTREVAEYIGRSKSWVDQQCRSGSLRYELLGQTRMIHRKDVEPLKGTPKQKPGPKPGDKQKRSAKKRAKK